VSAQPVIEEILVRPIEEILKRMGVAIAETQKELDRNSIATQVAIENDEMMSKYGLQATWYHIPEMNIELKMSLTMHSETVGGIERRFVTAALHNASYQNKFNYAAEGASTLKLKIASIPAGATSKAG